MKRFLITTADERSWKFDRPVLFLGEWCRLYDRRQIWENMDALVAEPYGIKADEKKRNLAYVHALSGRLLNELADELNALHNTQHSLRYWHILLGHWLQRYVAVAFNRYFTLEQTLERYEVSDTLVFKSVDYNLATVDSMSFIWACSDDVWNHIFYSKILSYWGLVKAEVDSEPIRGLCGFVSSEGKQELFRNAGIKRSILNAAEKILHELSSKRDAFIINSALPPKEEIKLQLGLWQWPQLWRSPALETGAAIPEKRQRLGIDAESHQGFERFVRSLLGEVIPICYLEGYSQLVQQVEALSWPTAPKFIFTSNNFDTDEIFKAWAGSMVEQGVPYFTGQHGNNYGTLMGSQNWPELVTCDKFFTWGWTNGSIRNVPAFVFKLAGRKPHAVESDGGLLLIELHPPHRFGPEDSYFEFGIYQEEQFRFVAAVPEDIQQKLTVRLHRAHKNLCWSDEQRWADRSPQIRIETGAVPIQELIVQSRLVVHSYDSTGILETLALNIPTLCFWHGGLDHLLPSAKPYYELLRSAGILTDTPEQAAAHVALHWDNVSEWWASRKVQDARNIFCEKYARTEKHPVRVLRSLLTQNAKRPRN